MTKNKLTAAWLTTRAAGKTSRQLMDIITRAKMEGAFEIKIEVYGKEWNEGFKAGQASALKTQIIVDEVSDEESDK